MDRNIPAKYRHCAQQLKEEGTVVTRHALAERMGEPYERVKMYLYKDPELAHSIGLVRKKKHYDPTPQNTQVQTTKDFVVPEKQISCRTGKKDHLLEALVREFGQV
ncbi:hypothetical protein IT396_00450 [Candidatus Nomurabacteria bacterium]|nr:hypothetical protein [Candidatus Nomurabacteria bacterium]